MPDDVVIVETFPHRIKEILNLWIPLKDGSRLAARMWIPADAEQNPVPAVLEYIPYRKRDATAIRDSKLHPYFAGHGYAAVRVDMRGSGDSDGVLTDEYLKLEHADAREVIEWLSTQKWCTGSVGMMGNSWGGFNSLQVAARRPPALKAIITSCSTDDRYADDIHYMGGCLLNDNMKWAANMFSHNSRPPDPDVAGNRWHEMWLERLKGSGLWIETWLSHQRRDAFWKHGSVSENYADITCAVFAVGGWNDGYSNAIPRLMEHLTCPRIAWIGQWSHQYPHDAAPGPAVGFLQEAIRWWDHWLKGRDTGMMKEPMVRSYIQDYWPPVSKPKRMEGHWVADPSWPPPGVKAKRLILNRGGTLDDKPGPETALSILSPLTPGHYGRWCPHGLGPDMPTDQRELDGNALCFDSEPFKERVELLGAPVVELDIASDKPNAMICVRLGDIAPDGRISRITYQLLNLTHRDSHEFPDALVPGKRYRIKVKLNDLGQAIEAGHRLRVAISTSYWPIAWTSPESATLTIRAGASHIDLPVRPAEARDKDVKFPRTERPKPLAANIIEKGGETRDVIRDIETGRVTSHAQEDGGTVLFDATGWTMRAKQDQWYSILPDDPLSARAEVAWSVRFWRGTWNAETRTRTVLTSTSTHFRLDATLDAFTDGNRIYSRNWNVEIPRDHV